MKKITALAISILCLIGTVFVSCEKDEDQNLDDWTPQNLLITRQSTTDIELSWDYYGPATIDGFKIDRKAGNEGWIESFAILPVDTRTWIDTTIIPEPASNYYYRVYAFQNEVKSSYLERMIFVIIPEPDTVIIEKISLIANKLAWHYEYNTPDSYQVERSYDEEIWDVLTSTNNKYFFDSIFNMQTDIYYRVCAINDGFKSEYSKNATYSDMPAPTSVNIKANSYSSLSLFWDFYSIYPISHFKIDKQENDGSWLLEYAIVDAGERAFTDSNVDLENNDYSYAVYACVSTFESYKIHKTINYACGIATLTDPRDGIEYETVQIGDYCWMKQNLAYLPSVYPPSASSETTPLYYVYDYTGGYVPAAKETENHQSYGVLYNYPAALEACPDVDVWQLPNLEEFEELVNISGGKEIAANHLREVGADHWSNTWPEITNASGFTALPGGERTTQGFFHNINSRASFWSGSGGGSFNYNYALRMWGSSSSVSLYSENKENGFSIRCVKRTLF